MAHPLVSEIAAAAPAKGVTVTALCKELGIARWTWYRWQRGRFNPSLHVYQRLISLHAKLIN